MQDDILLEISHAGLHSQSLGVWGHSQQALSPADDLHAGTVLISGAVTTQQLMVVGGWIRGLGVYFVSDGLLLERVRRVAQAMHGVAFDPLHHATQRA
jgi:hypothetical protein